MISSAISFPRFKLTSDVAAAMHLRDDLMPSVGVPSAQKGVVEAASHSSARPSADRGA